MTRVRILLFVEECSQRHHLLSPIVEQAFSYPLLLAYQKMLFTSVPSYSYACVPPSIRSGSRAPSYSCANGQADGRTESTKFSADRS